MNTSASSSSAATPPAALSGLPLRSLALAQSLAVAGLAHAQSPAPAAAPEDLNGDAPHEMPRLTVEEQRRAVSSPKFTAPLVNTPQTVSVIPREIFNQQGAASLADVLGNTPGITFLAGEGGHVSGANSLVMRGFDATGSIFIDGVRDSGNYSRDVYNLEQVEVVKGPAGDNGRGTAAGYINLSTKAPLAADFAHSTVSYGFDEYASIERRRATIDLNQDLDGRIAGAAFRLNALWEDGGVAGRDHAEKNTWGVAPSLIFGLGTATRITLAYQHDEQDDLPDYGALGGILTDTATSVRPRQPVDRSRFYGHVSDFNRVDLDVLSARVEHDITPTMRLTNVSRFSNNDRDAIYTVPANLNAIPDMNTGEALEIVPTNRQAFFREIETLSNQTNLAAQFTTGSVDHAFAAGLELIREDGETLRDWTGLGTLGELSKIVNQTAAGAPTAPTMVVGTSPYQPNPYRPITGFAPTYRFIDDVRIDTAALYAFDTLRFNDRWQATAGLRLEYYEASYNIFDRTNNTNAPFEFDDTLLTGKVGVVYKPARHGSVYASWGVAAQPPGTSNLSNDNGSRNNGTPPTTGQNSPNADPQESYNYELGTKWELFDRRLTTSLALFRSERTNVVVATDAGSGDPAVYGDQTVQGIELGLSGRITPDWVVFGGWSYLDSENRNPSNPVQDGSDLQWTPTYSGNLWTTYRLPFGLTVGGGTQYTGESRVSLNNTSAGVLPDRWIVNVMAAYEVNEHLSLRFNVTNVADELYARSINNNSNRVYLGDPRSYLLSAELKF